MIDALDEAKNTADCINLARANHRRLDQDKSNIARQGHWPPLKSKSTSVLLHDPTLTALIDINPMNTINPDQDIAPNCEYVISKVHGNMPTAGKTLANVYAPSGKLCGTITFERLQILYHAFTQSRQNQPEVHQQHRNPTFEHALARLLNRYSNKHTMESKTIRIKNHWTTPDEYMKAIVDGLSITTERFASPLNFNVASDSYCMYSEDKLFGATHDAYSHKWQGLSQANPEYEAKDMEKALRWAIFSAQETDEPVLTTFVLPDWAGTAYLRWMSHPLVQEIATIKKTRFRFKDPKHWATGKEFSSHAKWDTKFLMVANTAGLQQFVKQETLQAAFAHASTLLQHPRPQITQLRNTVTAASSLQGLYPPAGFTKAAEDMNTLWTSVELPTEATLQQALYTNIVKETELLHCPQNTIYTDGSKREMHTFGTVTGSGVYRQAPTAALQLKVHPIGQGMLNTINRAELVTILVALRECRPYEDECIATDSRCSKQKINKHLRAPAQTKDDCHQPLLQAITTLIVERAKTGLTTKIMKVKSHIGIHGNEMADKLANEAAEECTKARQFDRDVSQKYCEPFKDKFWLQHEIQVHNNRHLKETRNPWGSAQQLVTESTCEVQTGLFKPRLNLLPIVEEPAAIQRSKAQFRTMRCFSKRTKERIDKLRWGKTWTKKAAFMQHRSYLTGQPIATNSKCPLPGCQGNDGAGHCLNARMRI